MSTSYYALQTPITSLRVKALGGHIEVTAWINGAHSGTLVVRNEELTSLLRNLFTSDERVYHSSAGWNSHTYPEYMLNDNAQVISEYGELFTVAEIKEKYASTH